MLFLTSLLYVGFFYVLPGQFLIVRLAPELTFLPEFVAILSLNLIAYVLIATVVRMLRFAEEELDGERNGTVRKIKAWLCPAGTGQFTFLMLLLLGVGVAWQAFDGALPVASWPLYAAIALGSLGALWTKSAIPLEIELPTINCELIEGQSSSEEETESFHFAWQFSSPGKKQNRYTFQEVFELEPEWDDDKSIKDFKVCSLDDYGTLPAVSASPAILAVAKWFRRESIRLGFSPTEEMANVAAFVRSLPADSGIPFPSPPEPTSAHLFITGGGKSSEVRTLLAATLLYQLGHHIAFLYHHLPDGGFLSLAWRGELPQAFCIEDEDGTLFAEISVNADEEEPQTSLPRAFTEGVDHHRVIAVYSNPSVYPQVSDR